MLSYSYFFKKTFSKRQKDSTEIRYRSITFAFHHIVKCLGQAPRWFELIRKEKYEMLMLVLICAESGHIPMNNFSFNLQYQNQKKKCSFQKKKKIIDVSTANLLQQYCNSTARITSKKKKQKIPQGTKLEPKGCHLIFRQLFACITFMSFQQCWYSMCMK